MLLLLALLNVAIAQGDPASLGLDPVTRQFYERALASEEQGEWRQAAAAWRLVLSRDPGFPPAVLGLGRALELAGDRAGAEDSYRSLPMDADAVEALGFLIEAERPAEAAALYRRLQTLRLGAPRPWLLEARALVAIDELDPAVESLERYLALAGDRAEASGAGDAMVALAEALRGAERPEEAAVWLERYLERWPEGPRVEAVDALLDRLLVEQRATTLHAGGAEPIPAGDRPRLEQARKLVARGEVELARLLLEDLLSTTPRSAEVWAAMGALLMEEGAFTEAERAWLTATALAPDEPSYLYQLAALLSEAYGGRRHGEAAQALREALALRPGWVELHYRLGVLHQEQADYEAAIASLRTYLAASPSGALADDARTRLTQLGREPPEPPRVELLASSRPAVISEAAWDRYRVVRVYLERGEDAAARAELDELIRLAPEWEEALNLQAALRLRAGEPEAALRAYERSLEVEPDQPLVLMEIAEILEARGDLALASGGYRQAADAGAVDAWYELARLADAEGRWLDARRHLDAYFARATGGPAQAPAIALRDELDQRWRLSLGGAGALGLFALGLPVGLVLRRRGGVDLRSFLERHPEHFPDAARIIGAMRHEVIKHNTTVLPSVADALEAGDPGPALDVADHLCGEVVRRWERYRDELVALARRSGVRLEPRLDPILGPMELAFRDLRRTRSAMRRGRARIAPRLREISEALNGRAYQELGQLSREICVTELDAALIGRCWQSVREEPAFSEVALPELELWIDEPEDEGPLPAKIFQRDLEEILINLLRNALQATLDAAPPGGARLGVFVEEEVDFVTGWESVVIRVLDASPRRLTDAMIRGQEDVGRGFGIVMDRVTRADGSVKVEPGGDGWAKAVAVRLPRAE